MFYEAWLQFYHDQIHWRNEKIRQLQDEIYCLSIDKIIVCGELQRQVTFTPWNPQLQDRHAFEALRYDDEISHLYQEIDRFEVDKLYFYEEIGFLKASSGVDEPPPKVPFFMSLNDFLSSKWIKEPSTFPNLPLEKENIIITRELFVLTTAETEKRKYLIRQ